MKVRVGILGAGFMGRVHALHLRVDERVAIVGVADAAPQAAERLAGEIGARAFPSFETLADAGIHALYVTTPNAFHVEPVLAALGRGLHVFCEKPMATSLQNAWRIREAATRSKGIYQIGFNRRFADVYRFAKRLIEDGELVPLVAQVKQNRGDLRQPMWVGDPKVAGGYLYETPIHALDLSRFLFGEVHEIQGWARQSVYQELDGFVLMLRFAGGLVASLTSVAHTGWFAWERLEIYGDHRMVATEEFDRAWYSRGIREQTQAIECAHLPFERKRGIAFADRLFIDAVQGEGPPAVTAEDGYRATELVEACYRAVREGCAVRLPLPEPEDAGRSGAPLGDGRK